MFTDGPSSSTLTISLTMLNKRQQLQQQQLIYGGRNSIPPIRGIRSQLLRHTEQKQQLKDSNSGPAICTKDSNSGPVKCANPSPGQQRKSAPVLTQKTAEGKNSTSQRQTDSLKTPVLTKAPDAKVDGSSVPSKETKSSGRPRRHRSVFIPQIHYGDKHIPRNMVTIDISKARGNTDVIRLAARDLGWREISAPRRDHNCDVIWHAISFFDQPDIFSGQVNKFPGSLEVFHKVGLFRQLMLMKTLFPEDFTFFPRTWILPAQFHEFCNDVRQQNEARGKAKPKPTFIAKPSEGSQGEGIYLLRDPQSFIAHGNRTYVVQDYLNSVLTIDSFKFDLRVYVMVRRIDPLEIYICNEGLARFSTVPYENPTNKNLHETFMHLTNYSLNKRSAAFNKSDKDDEGSKRKMTSVFKRMERMGYDTVVLWKNIETIVCKTMVSVAGELKVEYQAALPPGKPHPSCFQVLGFDILILKDLTPMLLEVNSNPSLSITGEQEVSPGVVEYLPSIKDEEVKRTLIRDSLILIAPRNKYTRKRRRKYRRRPQKCVEEMEVDSPANPSNETRHRNHRERDITIRFEDSPSTDQQRSIFAESDKKRPPYQRQETCRVFVEGEGEITRFDTPPYYYQQNLNSSNSGDGGGDGSASALNRTSSQKGDGKENRNPNDEQRKGGTAKDSVFLDWGERQHPSNVFQRNKMERSAEAFMEEDGPSLPPLPYELTLIESSEDENEVEEESCLKEILPAVYAEEMKPLRLPERLADIFIGCLSVRGCLRMGPTAFRMFARKCRLNRRGMNSASLDILYIDMQRKWDYLNPDRTPGLGFQGFVDACMEIARRKFSSSQPASTLESFISYCEDSIRAVTLRSTVVGAGTGDEDDTSSRHERVFPRALRNQRRSVNLFPRRTITSLEEESVQGMIQNFMHKQRERSMQMGDINSFIRNMRHRTYVPSALDLDNVVGGGGGGADVEDEVNEGDNSDDDVRSEV